MGMIRMKALTSAEFAIETKNNDYLYFITDTQQIYKGSVQYTANSDLDLQVNSNELVETLTNAQTTAASNSTIKKVTFNITGAQTLNNVVTTVNNVGYVFNGNNTTFTCNGLFSVDGVFNEFNNIVFTINNTEGLTTISKNTVFKNCKFITANDCDTLTITLNAGCSAEFVNCVFVGADTNIQIINTDNSGFRLTNITNCIFKNGGSQLNINSSNADEVVNITYAKGLEIVKDDNNQADVYDMYDVEFNTVDVTGE